MKETICIRECCNNIAEFKYKGECLCSKHFVDVLIEEGSIEKVIAEDENYFEYYTQRGFVGDDVEGIDFGELFFNINFDDEVILLTERDDIF